MIPKTYEPITVEAKWYSFWNDNLFFQPNTQSKKQPFSIVIPPPNITGALHMGHALGDTLDDVLIRYHRMMGNEALWVPGTDHAGIATQSVVERQVFAETGKRKNDFARDEFVQKIWDWKDYYEKRIIDQLKQLGCSCDWSRLSFTMDAARSNAVRYAFRRLFEDQLIYRGDYLVNWDPVLQTALSDDEVEYEERASFLWFIRYPLEKEDRHITIATTRPETMFGDVAVAVNPNDDRYRSLIGKRVRLPLTQQMIPIIADEKVDPLFGTGAFKITPAHDIVDYEIAQRHNLPIINILTKDARLNETGGPFQGKFVDEARDLVVDALRKEGFLEKIEPHTLRVGVSYRSKAVIQPYLSKQWFLKVSLFKESLLSAVREKRVRLVPDYWQDTYEYWINNVRDWCISRQLWWGHRIPIWYNKKNPEQMISFDGEGEPPEVRENPDDWVQDPDVLDTWFSSALWPLSVMGWPDKTPDLSKFYPTSVLITGHDILFFWVARMILMSSYFVKEVPFHDVFLHGLIYGRSYWRRSQDGSVLYVSADEKRRFDLGEPLPPDVESKWEKMSKSKGNVINPAEVIGEYGADAVRMSLCSSVTHARQIDLDRRRFEEYKNFANKIWNGARFVLMNLEEGNLPGLSAKELSEDIDTKLLTIEDRWILSVLNRTIKEMHHCFTNYTFDRAADKAYTFFWNDFCAVYVEMVKPVLFGKRGTAADRTNKQKLLTVLLCALIRLMHPITPFITEEIFSLLKTMFSDLPKFEGKNPYTKDCLASLQSKACIVAPYPQVFSESDISLDIENEFGFILKWATQIRNIRAEMQFPPSEKCDLYLYGQANDPDWKLAKHHAEAILTLASVKEIIYVKNETDLPQSGASAITNALKWVIPIPKSLLEKERARLLKEKEKIDLMIATTESKLSNPGFREKAPPAIVATLEQNLQAALRQQAEIMQKLRSFVEFS